MIKPIQNRTLKTRAKLVTAAQDVIATDGYEALRVERVVQKAGVAKGTFFAHFKDKDALMEQLIGARMNDFLDRIESAPTPQSVSQIIEFMMPGLMFMSSARYVFDVILRHSGAAAKDEIGEIAKAFGRFDIVVAQWLENGPFRRDIEPALLAEGVGAFMIQALALHFCALHCDEPVEDRLERYLSAWLQPVPPMDGN